MKGLLALVACLYVVLLPYGVGAETLGVKESDGSFVPKLDVTVGDKEIVIRKIKPEDKIQSLSITLNKKNRALVQNAALLNVLWLDQNSKPGRAVIFAGPRYDPKTLTFEDSLLKSMGLKIIDKTTRNLFSGKDDISELVSIRVNDRPCVAGEATDEREAGTKPRTVSESAVKVDKASVNFNRDNLKKGETIEVDNRSGKDLVVGIKFPEKGLTFVQVVRRPEQTKIPRENWERFVVAPDSGVFLVLIPQREPALLAELEGTRVEIRVWNGASIGETIALPIVLASDVVGSRPARRIDSDTPVVEPTPKDTGYARQSSRDGDDPPVEQRPRKAAAAEASPREPAGSSTIWLWVIQIGTSVIVVAFIGYWVFFALPRIQVMESRLAKSEMAAHGTLESIRDEQERFREEILRQCSKEFTKD
ncbi:MAG: hypothetical protein V2B18_03705 [Pseudomonadota bacterium]